MNLDQLRDQVIDPQALVTIRDYEAFCVHFLDFLIAERVERIVSPVQPDYSFYQLDVAGRSRLTRPINQSLFLNDVADFQQTTAQFSRILALLRAVNPTGFTDHQVAELRATQPINKTVYTIQQAIGCVGDSFANSNQSRKRIGQLFEGLMKLILQAVGVHCESRTVILPIPGYPGFTMKYELDVVFSRGAGTSPTIAPGIQEHEVVGSIKTTSKDRLDKIFLDKFILARLLQRDIPLIAIFLHDVQRGRRGQSPLGVNSTFKRNHFLGYTVSLNALDGVYYVDPRPAMLIDDRLRAQISDFQQFLLYDLWYLLDR